MASERIESGIISRVEIRAREVRCPATKIDFLFILRQLAQWYLDFSVCHIYFSVTRFKIHLIFKTALSQQRSLCCFEYCIQGNVIRRIPMWMGLEIIEGIRDTSFLVSRRLRRTAKLKTNSMTVLAQNAREWHARRYPAGIKLNAVNVVGISCCYCRLGVILSSARSKREMRTRTTVRLSRSDAIRNNGLLVRKDKVEWRSAEVR